MEINFITEFSKVASQTYIISDEIKKYNKIHQTI